MNGNNRTSILVIVSAIVALVLGACSSGGQPTAAPQPTVPAANSTAAPAANSTSAPQATAPSNAASAGGPAWWPTELAMPAGTHFDKEVRKGLLATWRLAFWTAPNPNVDSVRDLLFQEAKTAGYQYFTIPQGMVPGKLYTIYIWKSTAAYQLTLAQTSDNKGTKIQGGATGILHLKATGSTSLDMDLPVTTASFAPKDLAKSVALAAEAPNAKCNNCFFAFGMDGSGYNGPATYAKWNDVRVNPGGVEDLVKIYRGAKSCTFVVKDELSGTFDCKGLHPENDLKKTLDVSGSWQIASQG